VTARLAQLRGVGSAGGRTGFAAHPEPDHRLGNRRRGPCINWRVRASTRGATVAPSTSNTPSVDVTRWRRQTRNRLDVIPNLNGRRRRHPFREGRPSTEPLRVDPLRRDRELVHSKRGYTNGPDDNRRIFGSARSGRHKRLDRERGLVRNPSAAYRKHRGDSIVESRVGEKGAAASETGPYTLMDTMAKW
jgi:hypothetical protein